jgi:hypothetical protein
MDGIFPSSFNSTFINEIHPSLYISSKIDILKDVLKGSLNDAHMKDFLN